MKPHMPNPGDWVKEEIYHFMELKGFSREFVNRWLVTPSPAFGDLNAYEMVGELVKIGNADSYADAWHEVLAVAARCFE